MGRRAGTETIAKLLVAFLRRPRWTQKELERICGVEARAVRRGLLSLQEASVPLTRDDRDVPHVFWSVPKGWFPDVANQLVDQGIVARLVARLPRSEERQRVLGKLLGSNKGAAVDPNPRALDVAEGTLSLLEDACRTRRVIRLGYFSASRGEHGIRVLSVQRIAYGDRIRFIAHCHTRQKLLIFRADRATHPEIMETEAYVEVNQDAVDGFLGESLDGFHGDGGAVRCQFHIRYPEGTWAVRALPPGAEGSIVHYGPKGAHVELTTAGLEVLARFLVGLGEAVTIATPDELRDRTAELARGAIRALGGVADVVRTGPKRADRIGPRSRAR